MSVLNHFEPMKTTATQSLRTEFLGTDAAEGRGDVDVVDTLGPRLREAGPACELSARMCAPSTTHTHTEPLRERAHAYK